jgi:hypothetical protein
LRLFLILRHPADRFGARLVAIRPKVTNLEVAVGHILRKGTRRKTRPDNGESSGRSEILKDRWLNRAGPTALPYAQVTDSNHAAKPK